MKTIDVNAVFRIGAKHARDIHLYFQCKLKFQHSGNYSASMKTEGSSKKICSCNYDVAIGGL